MAGLTTQQLVKKIAAVLDNKKAADIKAIKVEKLTTLGDYFIIASGGSATQVKALADEVEEKLSQEGLEPKRVEGYQTANWVLLDYSDILVHLFSKEAREFYSLDRLWADGEQVDLSDVIRPD